MEINERISILMEHYNISPSEFSEKVDVQRSSISHITSGRNKPSLEFITKVKNAFPEIEWDWLINNKGPMLKVAPPIIEPKEDARKLPLPDIFSIIDSNNFGQATGNPIAQEIPNDLELPSPLIPKNDTTIPHSQPVENLEKIDVKKEKKVKRVIIFFEDGTFEAFEN